MLHLPQAIYCKCLEYKYFIISKVVVAGGDYLFTWIQAFKYLIELRVLTSDPDFSTNCTICLR